jgi:hypothetical protein
LEKRNGEFNERHIISRKQKYKPFAEVQGQAQGTEEVDILSHKDGEIRNGEQRRSKRRTVMICDDERDILKMFAIELHLQLNCKQSMMF